MQTRRLGLVLLASLGLASGLAAAPLRITGRIVAPPGSPAIAIELRPLVTGYADGVRQLKGEPVPPVAAAKLRPDGSFELLAPESGIYRVGVHGDGFLPVEAQLIPLVEDTELPAVALDPAVPVEITVLGSDGKPAAGVRLRALPLRAFTTDATWRPAQGEGVTSSEGRLTLQEKSGEELSLVVLAPGVPDRFVQKVEAPRHTLRLTRAEPRVLEIRGADGGSLPASGGCPASAPKPGSCPMPRPEWLCAFPATRRLRAGCLTPSPASPCRERSSGTTGTAPSGATRAAASACKAWQIWTAR